VRFGIGAGQPAFFVAQVIRLSASKGTVGLRKSLLSRSRSWQIFQQVKQEWIPLMTRCDALAQGTTRFLHSLSLISFHLVAWICRMISTGFGKGKRELFY
jgi:hypothetical protein